MTQSTVLQAPPRTWLITGVSSGIGCALAEGVLRGPDRVIGTVRRESDRTAFEAVAPGRAIGRLLDIGRHEQVPSLVAKIESEIGPIDVLVNNAGYITEGIIEEATFDDIRQQIEINLFGTLAVTKAVLPFMRRRRAGMIMIVASALGIVTLPGAGLYSASKFALQGVGETLAAELRPFGIRVTVISPGGFRTESTGTSLKRVARSIPDYDPVIGPASARRTERHGKEPGDPRKLAAALIRLADSEDPPVHFLPGPDVIHAVRAKFKSFDEEIARWEELAASTDFD